MKKVLTKFVALGSIGLLMLSACKKDGALVTSNGGKAGTLSASSATVTLVKASYADTTKVITFTFTKPSFGFSAAVTNTLQIDSMGDNWKKPTSLTLPNSSYSVGYSTGDFNTLLLKLNLPGGKTSQVQVRVEHSISNSVAPVYSNVLTLAVQPFTLISYVWVPGTYQSSIGSKQWSPATADSLVSPTDNGVYTGYVYFQGGDNFKVTSNPDWNHTNYGDAGGGAISASGGNLTSPGAGLYFVTVDLNKNTISYSAYNHTWSLIGDADVDWNTDFQMPFVQNDNAYEVVTTLKATGGFKFRADNAWALSYGNPTPITGQLTSVSGGNLAAPTAGSYLVKFTFGNPLLAPSYSLTAQ